MKPKLFPLSLTEDQEERAARAYAEALVFDGCLLGSTFRYPKCMAEYRAGGLTGGITTIAAGHDNFTRGIQAVLQYRRLIAERSDEFMLCTRASDLEQAKASGRLGVVFGFQDAKPVEDDMEHLDAFAALGVRVIQLTYNIQNFVGSGCSELHQNGLTHFGRRLVKEMNRQRIAIDLSHCSNQTTEDAIECSEKPALLTHANAYSVCPAEHRNATDAQLRALAEKGGVIGIVLRPQFVKRDQDHYNLPCTVEDVLDHIDHVAELVGVDHVGIGSDINTELMIPGTSMVPHLVRLLGPQLAERRRTHREVFGWSDVWDEVQGLESALHFVNLARGLVSRGYGSEDVKKILGGNFIRVLGEIWGDQEPSA